LEAAERCIGSLYPAMRHYPGGFASAVTALEELLAPPTLIVLRGPLPQLRPWLQALAPEFRPTTLVLGIDSVTNDLPAALDKPPAPGRVNAYVCRGVTCLAPVSRLDALREALGPPE
jgi:uncharacterized protein YyaL (SSP411 family)